MCSSCESLVINGLLCHEQGCPEAWKDEKRVCRWCGCEFEPSDKDQDFCCEDCAQLFHGGGYDDRKDFEVPEYD